MAGPILGKSFVAAEIIEIVFFFFTKIGRPSFAGNQATLCFFTTQDSLHSQELGWRRRSCVRRPDNTSSQHIEAMVLFSLRFTEHLRMQQTCKK
eukprot:g3196.t1